MLKRISILFLITIISLTFIGTAIYKQQKQDAPALSGYVYQKQHWNNYGLIVRLYQKTLVATATTSLNGYFRFNQVNPGNYQLFLFDHNEYYLGQMNITQTKKNQTINFAYVDKNTRPLYLIETLGFCISLLILIIAFGILLKLSDRAIAWALFGLALSYALLNGIEFFQIVLAWQGNEKIAANIFPLKHLGLAWFGPIFIYFWMLFPRHSKLIQQRCLRYLLILPLIETVILLTWGFLGSDYAFTQFWKFTYNQFRIIIITQLTACIFIGLGLIDRTRYKEKSINLKNKLQVIEFGLLFFLGLVIIGVLIPVACFHGQELLASQYSLTASLSGAILFSLIFYTISRYRIISFQKLFSRSTTYTVLTLTLALVYSIIIIFLDKILFRQNNYLLNTYILMFCIVCIIPLRDKIQNWIESFFFGNLLKQHQSLLAFTKELITFIDQDKIAGALKTNLKKLLEATSVKIQQIPEATTTKLPYLERTNPQFFEYLPGAKGVEVAIPIQDKKLVGWLLLGPKKSGLEYSETEIELLSALAAQTAIALNNAKLYETLRQTEREMEQSSRLASLGTLAAGLAHEIKNPLAAINNLVKILPDRYQDGEFRQNFMEITSRQLERINSLLNNLLNFAKPSEVILKKINLSNILKQSLELIQVTARKANINIQTTIPENIILLGDEKALEQVFINLSLNALQAMPAGGTLTIQALQDKRKIRLSFADTGEGMDKSILEKIFDPFFTTKQQGTGLGLSIARRILEKHHASIHVKSELGQGTTVTMVFL